QEQGQFGDALVALRRGHELGSRDPKWPHPSASWVRQCERLVALDARLLAGDTTAGAAECLEFARLCTLKQFYGQAAQFFAPASPALPANLPAGHRSRAARAAALAGTGQGKDAGKLTPAECAGWRKQALDWLRADLKELTPLVERGKAPAVARLRHWLGVADL